MANKIGTWAITLREHAGQMEKAANDFVAFGGTDNDDHAYQLRNSAQQFRDDAKEYVNAHQPQQRIRT